ncbi:hypothetical protein PLESTF_000307400 [Pleodorina starrii]|nr:hypothetical protein PLESTM_001418100 [Pleodorina starrii]GLC65536.1 hypothetical protein PLESTF_000307400 [Pleodorina starrii]
MDVWHVRRILDGFAADGASDQRVAEFRSHIMDGPRGLTAKTKHVIDMTLPLQRLISFKRRHGVFQQHGIRPAAAAATPSAMGVAAAGFKNSEDLHRRSAILLGAIGTDSKVLPESYPLQRLLACAANSADCHIEVLAAALAAISKTAFYQETVSNAELTSPAWRAVLTGGGEEESPTELLSGTVGLCAALRLVAIALARFNVKALYLVEPSEGLVWAYPTFPGQFTVHMPLSSRAGAPPVAVHANGCSTPGFRMEMDVDPLPRGLSQGSSVVLWHENGVLRPVVRRLGRAPDVQHHYEAPSGGNVVDIELRQDKRRRPVTGPFQPGPLPGGPPQAPAGGPRSLLDAQRLPGGPGPLLGGPPQAPADGPRSLLDAQRLPGGPGLLLGGSPQAPVDDTCSLLDAQRLPGGPGPLLGGPPQAPADGPRSLLDAQRLPGGPGPLLGGPPQAPADGPRSMLDAQRLPGGPGPLLGGPPQAPADGPHSMLDAQRLPGGPGPLLGGPPQAPADGPRSLLDAQRLPGGPGPLLGGPPQAPADGPRSMLDAQRLPGGPGPLLGGPPQAPADGPRSMLDAQRLPGGLSRPKPGSTPMAGRVAMTLQVRKRRRHKGVGEECSNESASCSDATPDHGPVKRAKPGSTPTTSPSGETPLRRRPDVPQTHAIPPARPQQQPSRLDVRHTAFSALYPHQHVEAGWALQPPTAPIIPPPPFACEGGAGGPLGDGGVRAAVANTNSRGSGQAGDVCAHMQETAATRAFARWGGGGGGPLGAGGVRATDIPTLPPGEAAFSGLRPSGQTPAPLLGLGAGGGDVLLGGAGVVGSLTAGQSPARRSATTGITQELTPYRAALVRALVPVVEQTICSQLQQQIGPLVQQQIGPLAQQLDRFWAEQLNHGLQLADALWALSRSAAEAASLAQTVLLSRTSTAEAAHAPSAEADRAGVFATRSQKAVRRQRRQRLLVAAFKEAAVDVTPGRDGATAREAPQPARPPVVEQPRLPVELPQPAAGSELVAVGVTVPEERVSAAVHQPGAASVIRYLTVTGRGAGAKGSIAEKQLSFRLAPGWVIPNVLGMGRDGPAHSQWMEWCGEFNQLEKYQSAEDLWREWTEGVLLPRREGRLAPLCILEHPDLRSVWRSGRDMIKEINFRKAVIYALHRRIFGQPRSKEAATAAAQTQYEVMDLAAAWADLQREYQQGGRAPSVSLLSRTIREWKPSDYEEYAQQSGLRLFRC